MLQERILIWFGACKPPNGTGRLPKALYAFCGIFVTLILAAFETTTGLYLYVTYPDMNKFVFAVAQLIGNCSGLTMFLAAVGQRQKLKNIFDGLNQTLIKCTPRFVNIDEQISKTVFFLIFRWK